MSAKRLICAFNPSSKVAYNLQDRRPPKHVFSTARISMVAQNSSSLVSE